MKYLSLNFLLLLLILGCETNSTSANQFEYSLEENHMGTVFQITAISSDAAISKVAVVKAYAEVDRIEQLISSWISSSETSDINQNAGIKPVKVSDELFQLIYRSKKVSDLTNGIFDISFASVDKIWHFDGSMTEIPDSAELKKSVEKINYKNILLDDSLKTVFLKEKGMKIGFGAIGKGYTANKCKQLMLDLGIKSGVVNAGGDLICWGTQKNGQPWTIGIADPAKIESAFSHLQITDKAVVTSGNYERFVEINGIKYCHIINPKTGWPVEKLKSVTIICADAELADALATSVFILGAEDGIKLINQLKDIDCFIIDAKDEIFTSKNIALEYYDEK